MKLEIKNVDEAFYLVVAKTKPGEKKFYTSISEASAVHTDSDCYIIISTNPAQQVGLVVCGPPTTGYDSKTEANKWFKNIKVHGAVDIKKP